MEDKHAEEVLFMMLQGQDSEKAVPADGKNLSKETGFGSTWGLVPAGMEGGASVEIWKICWRRSEGDSW